MTADLKQTLFKGVTALASFAFAATGASEAEPILAAFQGVASSVASQFGVEVCMPYITKKWLSHPEKVVNEHIQKAFVKAIRLALEEIEQEYLTRESVGPQEAKSLKEFFAVLNSRSEQEYIDATRDDLPKPEVLDYVYNQEATSQHLTSRLRIELDPFSNEFYFTNEFIAYFPQRFAELVQFNFRTLLKEGKEAKQALDLLFFDTLDASLKELKADQQSIRALLDGVLPLSQRIEQQLEFYGEIWINAIRRMREQLGRIEQNTEEILAVLNGLGLNLRDVKDLLQKLFSQRIQPGLLVSVQFQQMTQALEKARKEFKKAQRIAQNSSLAEELEISPEQAQLDLLERDAEQTNRENELTTFLQDLLRTAETISQTDGMASPRLQQARDLYEQGRFAEATTALDETTLRQDKNRLLQQEATLQQKLEQLASEFILKAQLTVLNKESNWFEQARLLYQDAVETNETYDTCFSFAYFLAEHNQHNTAIFYYEKALNLNEEHDRKGTLLNNLGLLYADTNRFTESEKAYSEALQIYLQLNEQKPQVYLPDVAMTFNNLGVMFVNAVQYSEAEQAYSEALKIRRQLVKQIPQTYLASLAMTLNNLGVIYVSTLRYIEAEQVYSEALQIRRQLAQQNSQTHQFNLAMTLNNLGAMHIELNRFTDAEKTYSELLQLCRQLAEQSPQSHLPYLAITLNNLGLLYQNVTRGTDAEKAYSEALQIYRQLAEQSPYTYQSKISTLLNNLGRMYLTSNQYTEAELVYAEALQIDLQLAEQNPIACQSNIATTLHNLGALYACTNRPDDAKETYLKALQIRIELVIDNPEVYSINIAETAVSLGLLYMNKPSELDKRRSIECALTALFYTIPYYNSSPQILKVAQIAIQICQYWDIDWREELNKHMEESDAVE